MVIRLFISKPTINTPASRIYLAFYLSLIAIATLFILLQANFKWTTKSMYLAHFSFTGAYLLWNVLLNSYDVYRSGRGSSLAFIASIIFASIIIQLRPQHIIFLQISTFGLFWVINQGRIEDVVNSNIAVCVALAINILFYYQEIQKVHNQQLIKQMNAHIEKEQITGAKEYLRRLRDAQTQSAVYHHDLRHTLKLMEQFALQGDVEKLQAFVSRHQENQKEIDAKIYCENDTFNLILGAFDGQATEENVKFKADVRLPQNLSIIDTELCSLLFNLLENALNAAKLTQDLELRRVYIKAIINGGKLVILVENGFVGEIIMVNDRPAEKINDEQHGYGIKSIISVVERHRGMYTFETKGQTFIAKVLLYL